MYVLRELSNPSVVRYWWIQNTDTRAAVKQILIMNITISVYLLCLPQQLLLTGIKSKASLRLRLFCVMKYMHQYKEKR